MFISLSFAGDNQVELRTKPQSELNGLLTSALKANDSARVTSLLDAKADINSVYQDQSFGCLLGCESSDFLTEQTLRTILLCIDGEQAVKIRNALVKKIKYIE